MKNKFIKTITFLVLSIFTLNLSHANPPPALIFNAKVKSINESSIKAEVTQPNKIRSKWDQWDKIEATYKGCILDGEIGMLNGRINLKFQTLQCNNKPANQIKGLAISPEDMRIGLINNPKVGTSVSILVVDSYKK